MPGSRRPSLVGYTNWHKYSIISYSILLISSIIFLLTYGLLLPEFQTTIDFSQSGNLHTFLILYITCGITLVISIFVIWVHWKIYALEWRHVIWFEFILLLCSITIMLVGFGAVEEVIDVQKCRRLNLKCTTSDAPLIATQFGKYMGKVCKEPLSATCQAAKKLQIAVYSMYIWGLELLIVFLGNLSYSLVMWNRSTFVNNPSTEEGDNTSFSKKKGDNNEFYDQRESEVTQVTSVLDDI